MQRSLQLLMEGTLRRAVRSAFGILQRIQSSDLSGYAYPSLRNQLFSEPVHHHGPRLVPDVDAQVVSFLIN